MQTLSATSGAQTVSESTRATSGVRAASQPRRSASRLPGTSVTITVTPSSRAIWMEPVSVMSITQMISVTLLARQETSAARNSSGSSW
jgi:hypothetical protein